MAESGSLVVLSSVVARLRLRNEKAGFRSAGSGEGRGGGEEGREESSDSLSCNISDEKTRSAGGLDGTDSEDDVGALFEPLFGWLTTECWMGSASTLVAES